MHTKKVLSWLSALSIAVSSLPVLNVCADENAEKSGFVLMNIPYDDFYKAEIENDVAVDSVTSATKQKSRNISLVKGSYHVDPEGTDITGVTYPVKVDDLNKLSGFKKLDDSSKVSVTISGKNGENTTEFAGKDALFESDSYSYYVLDSEPENYKELSFDDGGKPVFSSIKGKASQKIDAKDIEFTAATKRGNYVIEFNDEDFPITPDTTVYGVVLKTKDDTSYGLRHLDNIWRGTELAWVTDGIKEIKGAPTKPEHYKSMLGKTISQVEYITDKGVFDISTNLDVDAYSYVYAGLGWDEFWTGEKVFVDGEDMKASSAETDKKGESDKGAFDAVTRATLNHGLHRGSFQSIATIYTEDKSEYKLSHWAEDGKSFFTTDGEEIGYEKGELKLSDGTTKKLEHYEVTGIKYVPVKVKTKELDKFKTQYPTTENGSILVGGFSEQQLSAYELKANVNAATHGMKTAQLQSDGTFKFSKRIEGTESGIEGAELKTAENIDAALAPASAAEAFGAFIRLNITGEGYGDLGSKMQAIAWEYYGNDEKYSKSLAKFGTKFAADNWMHKSMGIQLGLTDSLRCRLPEGTDGTGFWKITIYALGYKDLSIKVEAKSENIVSSSSSAVDTEALSAAVKSAEQLKKEDYTEKSWSDFETELKEAKEELASPHSQASVDEAAEHLSAAIRSLEKTDSKIEIKLSNVGNIMARTYNSKSFKPPVRVYVGGKKLKNGVDYTVKYGENKIGKGTVTITGIGNYSGTVVKEFSVIPRTVTPKIKALKNKFEVSFVKKKEASKYQIKYSTDKNFRNSTNKFTKNSKVNIKVSNAKKYYVKVRAITTADGKNYAGKWSAVKTVKAK